MGKIDNFAIKRFQMSLNILVTFCKGGSSNKYYSVVFNPIKVDDVKHCIYKGAFVESVEYLYGFIPEVFKEYCKQFAVEVQSKDETPKGIGYLDLFKAMKSVGKIDNNHSSFLSHLYHTRGELIHQTLMDKEYYYNGLSTMASKVNSYDLDGLYKYVIDLCKEINNSYDQGVKGSLIVKPRNVKPNKGAFDSRNVTPSMDSFKPSSIFGDLNNNVINRKDNRKYKDKRNR